MRCAFSNTYTRSFPHHTRWCENYYHAEAVCLDSGLTQSEMCYTSCIWSIHWWPHVLKLTCSAGEKWKNVYENFQRCCYLLTLFDVSGTAVFKHGNHSWSFSSAKNETASCVSRLRSGINSPRGNHDWRPHSSSERVSSEAAAVSAASLTFIPESITTQLLAKKTTAS